MLLSPLSPLPAIGQDLESKVRNVRFYPDHPEPNLFKRDLRSALQEAREQLEIISPQAERISESDRSVVSEFCEQRDKISQILQDASQLLED